jgi:hypothetical protein
LSRSAGKGFSAGLEDISSALEQAYRTEPVLIQGSDEQIESDNITMVNNHVTMVTNRDGTISFRTPSGRYVTAHLDGTLTARAADNRQWERFEQVRTGNGTIYFKSCHGKYVTTRSNGFLVANSTFKNDTERFQVVKNADGDVTVATSRNKSIAVTTHRIVDAATAKFRLTNCSHGVALRCSDGKYWTAKHAGSGITFTGGRVSPQACFSMSAKGDGRVSFKSASGKYVTATPEGSLKADSDTVEKHQLFERIDHPDGTLSLLSSRKVLLDTTKVHVTHVPSLFCFSYTMTTGPEWDIIHQQFGRGVSIFMR